MNNIDVCNMALASLGNSRAIQSFAEQSTEAVLCGRYYNIVRQKLLKLYPWSFATVVKSLTVVEDETDDKYTYVYEYPEDCLRILSVNAAGDTQTSEYNVYTVETDLGMVRRIVTDVESARISYLYDVQDEDTMPPEFVDALALDLASRLALPLSSSGPMTQAVSQGAALAVDTAKRMNALEQKEPPVTTNKYMTARR